MNARKTKPKQDSSMDEAFVNPEETSAFEASGDKTDAAAAESETTTESAEVASLDEQLEAAIAERDENYDRLLRAQAELENFRKRVRKETELNRLYQQLPLVRDLLPGLDNLQRALTAAESSQGVEGLVEGVRMVVQQFEDLLGRYSVKPIEAVGQPFDPNLHEAVLQQPSADHPPMTVIEEVQRGYILHDRVVRPSQVIVSTEPVQQTDESTEDSEE